MRQLLLTVVRCPTQALRNTYDEFSPMLSRDPFAPREKDFYTFLVKNTVTSLTLLSARVKEYVMKLTLLGVHHWYNWL